ncbi:MAG: hypothetical protein AAF433_16310 [Bacteroidota bacterium]
MLSDPAGSSISNCSGATGLATDSEDLFELRNCGSENDNFLAPLQLEGGEEYALFINNVSGTNQSIAVNFCGSVLFGPDDWVDNVCAPATTTSDWSPAKGLASSPLCCKDR